MKTVLITGGGNGMGMGIAKAFLLQGDRVIAIGSSDATNAEICTFAKEEKLEEQLVYLEKDLSLVKGNRVLVEEISQLTDHLDAVFFCASRHMTERATTADGIEYSFALDYLSRYVLSYGLKPLLEKGENPMIMNFCGTGVDGEVNWDDLQYEQNFDPMLTMMHGSRLNNLLGVEFARREKSHKIKYMLYNPSTVKTPGMIAFFGPSMKSYMDENGKELSDAVDIVMYHVAHQPESNISAYIENEEMDLSRSIYNPEKAEKLYTITEELLEKINH